MTSTTIEPIVLLNSSVRIILLGGLQRLCNSYFGLVIKVEITDKILFFPWPLADWPVHLVHPYCIRVRRSIPKILAPFCICFFE